MSRSIAFVAPICVMMMACSRPEPSQAPDPDHVLVDVTVIDGTGAAPQPGRTVEIAARHS